MDIGELRRRRLENRQTYDAALRNLEKIRDETVRLIDVTSNAKKILDEIDAEFESQTGLNSTDMAFLFFATALQCVRQYWLSNDRYRFKSDQASSKFIKKYAPVSLTGPVPYDAFKKADGWQDSSGISGINHRYTTLGHDPLLGWVFGTANILTETVTKKNILLESYDAKLLGGEYRIAGNTNIGTIFNGCYHIVISEKRYTDLAKAVAKHAIHLSSDAFTKQGLPIPLLNNILPDELVSQMLSCGIDFYSVTRGMALSTLINAIVSLVHSLFYDPVKYPNRDIYTVKTRKVLLYSNLIASVSNVLQTAVRAHTGDVKSALETFDLGGLIVTLYRIVTDVKFIQKIKREFIINEFNKRIRGEDLGLESV
ncbi:MAG: hypothetical protein K6E42_04065 [Synergistes sp.]|nr:hypothetical protein [Synergistes sp.]